MHVSKCAHIVDFLTTQWENVSKGSEKKKRKLVLLVLRQTKNSDLPTRKCFRCESEYHLIAKCPKPPKYSKKRRKSDKYKEKGNRACDNSDDDNDHKIYAYMAQMYSDLKRESKDYGDSSQLTNLILDSGATCHITPEVMDFIPGSLEDTDKFIEVADGDHVTAKQKGSVRIQMCDDNGKTFLATLYNVLSQSMG